MLVNDKDNKKNIVDKEYEELVLELKKDLPNILLPSMGMFDDQDNIRIDGKDFVISDNAKEV